MITSWKGRHSPFGGSTGRRTASTSLVSAP
jgi:hypothetical protein